MTNKKGLNSKKIMVWGVCLTLFMVVSAFFIDSGVFRKENKVVEESDTAVSIQNSVKNWVYSKIKRKLGVVDYITWLQNEENGLIKQKKISYYKFTLQYNPSSYMVLKETKNITMPQDSLDMLSRNYDEFHFFNLSIEDTVGNKEILRSNISSQEDYQRRIEYFSFLMQKDLYLIEGKDSVPCIIYNFERVYNLAPKANFIIGFKKNDKNKYKDKIFVYEDKVFGIGIIKMRMEADQLLQVPVLKMVNQ